MFISPQSQAGVLIMSLICAFAFLAGRWPERLVAVVEAVSWVGSEAVQVRITGHGAQPLMFAVDAADLLIFLAVALRCGRRWILFATAYQMMIVISHLVLMLDLRIDQWEFFSAYFIWSYMALVAIGVGAAIEGRRPPAPPAGAFTPRRAAAAAF